jgi:hypothetical protein
MYVLLNKLRALETEILLAQCTQNTWKFIPRIITLLIFIGPLKINAEVNDITKEKNVKCLGVWYISKYTIIFSFLVVLWQRKIVIYGLYFNFYTFVPFTEWFIFKNTKENSK